MVRGSQHPLRHELRHQHVDAVLWSNPGTQKSQVGAEFDQILKV